MNILVFSFHPLFQRHFATELEIIQRHIKQEDTVTVLVCNADLLACDTNIEHDPGRCALCIQSRNMGLSLLEGKTWKEEAFVRYLLPKHREEIAKLQLDFLSMKDVLEYAIENFDIGTAVISSIIGQFLVATIDPNEHRDRIRRFMLAALSIYRATQTYLAQKKPDKVYIFNGRMSNVRAVLRACEQQNIPFTIHESGHDENTFSLFDNNMPHSIKFITQCIEKAWNEAPETKKRNEIANSWFRRRAGGVAVNGYSFVQGQIQGTLPTGWDSTKRNIVIFTSSDYEFIAVGKEWDHHIYKDQIDGLRKIIGAIGHFKDTMHIFIRIHPNHTGLPEELNALLALQSDYVSVIPPKEKVSSYTLMQQAEKVITFGSTAGIESAFWGKPSILGGRALYQNLGSVYTPQTHEELMTLVMNQELSALPQEGALKYAHFYCTYGQPFQYYKANTFFGGTFRGRVPFANRWLFRLHTLYKRTIPESMRKSINKRFTIKTFRKITTS
jgi:hypothetical protein